MITSPFCDLGPGGLTKYDPIRTRLERALSLKKIFAPEAYAFLLCQFPIGMARWLSVAILATALSSSPLSVLWAQDKAKPGPPYPDGSEITFQWVYSCPANRGGGCSFSCPGSGGAAHATKLTFYLGTVKLGRDKSALGLFYEFATKEVPNGNGFTINTGLGTLSCQVNGMILDYSGAPRTDLQN